MPGGCEDSVRPTVCVAVSSSVSLPAHICLGPKGHLAPFLGWLVGPGYHGAGQDGQVQR